MTRAIAIALCLALAQSAWAQKQYVYVTQFVTDTNPPVVVVEEVTSLSNALEKVAEMEQDPDLFGVPPAEKAYDATHHTHYHSGTNWPHECPPCPNPIIAQHRSKKTGLEYYVELEGDIEDGSEIATFYRLKAEKKADVNRLKAKCEQRSGKVLKVKKEKLK